MPQARERKNCSRRRRPYDGRMIQLLPVGAMLHLRGHAKTMDLEYYRGVFADKNHGYQVVAFATPQSFARVEPELAAMVRSFQPDCAAGSKSP